MKKRLLFRIVPVMMILGMLLSYTVIATQPAAAVAKYWIKVDSIISNPKLMAFMSATPIESGGRKGLKADWGNYYHELTYGAPVTNKYMGEIDEEITYRYENKSPRSPKDAVDLTITLTFVVPELSYKPGDTRALKWQAKLNGQLSEKVLYRPQLVLSYYKKGGATPAQRTVLDSIQLDINHQQESKMFHFHVPEISGNYERIGISYAVDASIGGEKTWLYDLKWSETEIERLPGHSADQFITPGRVTAVHGDVVEVLNKGESEWRRVNEEAGLYDGDTVRTTGCSASISFQDANTGEIHYGRIGPGTEVSFDEWRDVMTEKPGGLIKLIKGVIRWWVAPGKGIFSVEEGTTLCGGRGCDFIFKYMPENDDVQVFVREGTLTVTNSTTGLKRDFKEGQRVSVNKGKVTDVQTMDDDTWNTAVKENKVEADEKTMSSSTSQGQSSESQSSSGDADKKIKIGPLSCFIATAVYGSETAKELDTLRAFRDKMLMKSEPGRSFVDAYHRVSSPLAEFIADKDWLKTIIRFEVLDPIVFIINGTRQIWNDN